MNKHILPRAVEKLPTNENVKHFEICQRLNVKFGNDILWSSQVCKRYKLFKNGHKEGETVQYIIQYGIPQEREHFTTEAKSDRVLRTKNFVVFCTLMFFINAHI